MKWTLSSATKKIKKTFFEQLVAVLLTRTLVKCYPNYYIIHFEQIAYYKRIKNSVLLIPAALQS